MVVEGVRVEKCVPFTSNLHSVAFINIKFHLPGEFPLGYITNVSLQKGGIAFGFDAAVEDAIISKETDFTIDGFVGEVVAVHIKNSMGPRTVPWGTPERTGREEDCDPSETILCDLPCRKVWIQVCVDPLMPYKLSLYCGRL